VELIQGGELKANLSGFKDGRLILGKTDADITLTDVLKFKWPRTVSAGAKSDVLLLKGGDILRGSIIKFDGQSVSLNSAGYGLVKIASKDIIGGGFTQPLEFEKLGRQLVSAEEDRLFLVNGDALGVTILSMSKASVVVKSQLGTLDLPRKSIKRFAFVLAQRKSEPENGILVSARSTDGDLITGGILGIDDRTVSLKTGYGKFTLMQEKLLVLSVNNGGVIYLSDLEPFRVEEVPFFTVIKHYRRDESIGGTPISLRGKRFEKGLGVHSKTRLTYKLGKAYSSFKGVIGIDDEAKGKGSVIFKILGDEKVLFESGDLTGSSDPQRVDVKISGVEQIVLDVGYGKGFHIGDRAVWADARVIR
jgi:hypothetical protein